MAIKNYAGVFEDEYGNEMGFIRFFLVNSNLIFHIMRWNKTY